MRLPIFPCAPLLQQTPERVGQGEAVYEVVSLQREAERSSQESGRLATPAEEEEADEGTNVSSFSSANPFNRPLFLCPKVKHLISCIHSRVLIQGVRMKIRNKV